MQKNRRKKIHSSTINLADSNSVWLDKNAKCVAYFCRRKPVKVDMKLIGELKNIATDSGGRNVRFCLHDTPEAPFQNMIILERKNGYYRPHKHLYKGESFHIIEGRMAVFTFNGNGKIADSCILEPKGAIVYKVAVNSYHAIIPLTDLIVYHEAKPGPFLGPQDSIFPEWSAREDDREGVNRYKAKLLSFLKGVSK